MVEIRTASEFDAQLLTTLSKSTFIETFAKDNTQEDMDLYVSKTFGLELQLAEIRDPNRFIEIAWIEDSPAVFLHLLKSTPDPSVQDSNAIEVLRLYVDSGWHGKGVGAALMDRGLAIAKGQGFTTFWLGVWKRNFRAQGSSEILFNAQNAGGTAMEKNGELEPI